MPDDKRAVDFFISYTQHDRLWAEWIAWVLEERDYRTRLQAWDFRPGSNFVIEMQRATQAARTLAVFSSEYFESRFCSAEWAASFGQDPTGALAKLIPVRVSVCEPPGLLKSIVSIDLFGLAEAQAEERLLQGVEPGRGARKPPTRPRFPAKLGPVFPGSSSSVQYTHERLRPSRGLSPELSDWKKFGAWLVQRVEEIDREHGWTDDWYADTAAEVEAEVTGRFGRRQLRRVASLANALKLSQERLVLVEGEPGSGKSVTLRHLAGTLAREGQHARVPSALPLYANLREFSVVAGSAVTVDVLKSFIRDQVAGQYAYAKQFLDIYFESTWQNGSWIVLLDSFDEIPEILSSVHADAAVARYAEAIAALAQDLLGSRVVVASRVYRGPGRMSWPRFRILPLGEDARRKLVHSIFKNRKAADAVLGELFVSPLTAWLDNPFLLGLFCEHRRDLGRLPGSVHEAFEGLVEHRLERCSDWLAPRGFTAQQVREVLESIAFAMNLDAAVGLTVPQHSIRELLSKHGLDDSDVDVLAVADIAIAARIGRGIPVDSPSAQVFGFVHRRLQEYFATCAVIRGKGQVEPTTLLTDERWRETAVTLLETASESGRTDIVVYAWELLAEFLVPLESTLREVGEYGLKLFRQDNAEHLDLNKLRNRITPIKFPWPAKSLHVLGIVARQKQAQRKAMASRLGCQAADMLLSAAFVYGSRQDQLWAMECADAATTERLQALIIAAFSTDSSVLQDIAFRKAGELERLPPDIHTGIRKLVVRRDIFGQLSADPARTDAELRRVNDSDRLRRYATLLRLSSRFHTFAFVVVAVALRCRNLGWLVFFFSIFVWAAYGARRLLDFQGPRWLRIFNYFNPANIIADSVSVSASKSADDTVSTSSTAFSLLVLAYMCAVLCVALLDWRAPGRWLPIYDFRIPNHKIEPVYDGPIACVTVLVCLFRQGLRYAVLENVVPANAILLAAVGPLSVLRVVWGAVRRAPISGIVLAVVVGVEGRYLMQMLKYKYTWALLVAAWIPTLYTLLRSLRELALEASLRRRSDVFDTRELLEELSRFKITHRRAAALRSIRERGQLSPSLTGLVVLQNLLIAIERDIRRRRTAEKKQLELPDATWCKEFRDWYIEHARGRYFLADWEGATLDELVLLAEQVKLTASNKP